MAVVPAAVVATPADQVAAALVAALGPVRAVVVSVAVLEAVAGQVVVVDRPPERSVAVAESSAAASHESNAARSSTTCRRQPSAAYRSLAGAERSFGCRGVLL